MVLCETARCCERRRGAVRDGVMLSEMVRCCSFWTMLQQTAGVVVHSPRCVVDGAVLQQTVWCCSGRSMLFIRRSVLCSWLSVLQQMVQCCVADSPLAQELAFHIHGSFH